MMATAAAHGARAVRRGWVIVGLVALTVALLLAGMVYAIVRAIGGDASVTERTDRTTAISVVGSASSPAAGTSADQQANALAAAPMPTVPDSAAQPHTRIASRHSTAGLRLPAPRSRRGIVATGFPATPGGAVAQLATIEQAALADMNPTQAATVYADWTLPGAEPETTWSLAQFVRTTLTSIDAPDGTSQLSARFTVLEAQIKGVLDSGTFVLACVNGELDLSLNDTVVRTGAADCARMVWSDSRWQIGPGAQPATPPSVWPGTAEAAAVGWRPVTRA